MKRLQRVETNTQYSPLDLLKHIITFRFYLILMLIVAAGIFFSKFLDNQLIESSYFWILSSLVQGFSAFFGIIVALLTIELTANLHTKKELINRVKSYLLPIGISTITIIYSIVGMVIYPLLKTKYFLAQFVLISSSFAVWTVLEILVTLFKILSESKK